MGLKKLSDVKAGETITIGGSNYKIDFNDGRQVLVRKEVMPGFLESQKRGIGSLIQGYEGPEYHLVNVVEQKKTNLTEQLRKQVKSQSLTESLRRQIDTHDGDSFDFDDEEDCDDEEDEDDDDYYGFRGAVVDAGYRGPIVQPFNQAHSDAYAVAANEAKQSSLTANLRAQQAQQAAAQITLNSAGLKISVNKLSETVGYIQNEVTSLGYDIDHITDEQRDLAFGLDNVYDDAQEAKEVAYEAISRVARIEAKQLEEEKKVNLQNELNAKLAAKKAASDLQAQFDAKLNQKPNKTTGGNGTMKNLFGAFKNQFGKVEGKFAFSITTGGLAIRKGISQEFVAFEPATKAITDVTGLTLDFNVPAFKLPTAAEEVKVGDIVLNGADFGYVIKVNDGYVETIVPEKAAKGSVLPTTNALFGKAFYTVVKTLTDAGQGGFNPAMLLALGNGNKDELVKMMALTGGFGGGANTGAIDPTMLMLLGDNLDELLPFFLMQQGGVAAQGFNPLMLLALKDGGSKDKLLPLMMMQQGGGNINPMMLMALDGDIDVTTLALMGGFNGQGGLFGGAPATHTHKEVKGNK